MDTQDRNCWGETYREFFVRLEQENEIDHYRTARGQAGAKTREEHYNFFIKASPDYPPKGPPATAPKPKAHKQALDAKLFEGKNSDPLKDAEFVFNYMDIGDAKPEDAPSSGAWSLLQQCRNDPYLRKEFYRTIWPKTLPGRQQIEQRAKRGKSSGKHVAKLIETFQRATAEGSAAQESAG